MDSQRPWIPPLGMPPGHAPDGDQVPEGVQYFRIFAAFMLVVCGVALVALAIVLVRELQKARAFGADAAIAAAEIVVELLIGTPYLVVLLARRRPWVHTLGTIALALPMLALCCVPLALPVLVMWIKPETRRYFDPPAP